MPALTSSRFRKCVATGRLFSSISMIRKSMLFMPNFLKGTFQVWPEFLSVT